MTIQQVSFISKLFLARLIQHHTANLAPAVPDTMRSLQWNCHNCQPPFSCHSHLQWQHGEQWVFQEWRESADAQWVFPQGCQQEWRPQQQWCWASVRAANHTSAAEGGKHRLCWQLPSTPPACWCLLSPAAHVMELEASLWQTCQMLIFS